MMYTSELTEVDKSICFNLFSHLVYGKKTPAYPLEGLQPLHVTLLTADGQREKVDSENTQEPAQTAAA